MNYKSIGIVIAVIFISGFVCPAIAEDSQNVIIKTTRSHYYAGDTVKMEITVNEGIVNAIESIMLLPPEDDRAFANQVVDALIGGPENTFTNPNDALGPVNIIESCSEHSGTSGEVSLGGGYIVLDMGMDEEILDEPGSDLRVYEVCKEYYLCGDPESYEVYVSIDGANWDFVGKEKGVAEFDISNTSLDIARYVKIVDAKKDTGGDSPGPDIDAVKALRFEYGYDIFAESVIDYYPGGKDNKHAKPIDAVTPDDGKHFSLGGGYIIFDMGNGTEIINNLGSDIRVYEVNSFDQYSIYISQDMDEWTFVGDGMGTTEFDISSTGLSHARYVQVTDGIKEEEASGDSPGADIDGVKALRFEKWPNKVLFNGGKKWWGGEISGSSSAEKTVEFVIPTTLEQFGTKKFTVIVRYICAKESGPGFLQWSRHGEEYFANHHEHAIRTISIDVKPDGEKGEKTPGFKGVLAIAGLLAVAYLLRRRE
ncbi:MAG: PGF-CTERM sorting domain-containing protein [Methanophagales archaeon]|nr:PGF-CTERM sorting domain-containing protein [Methanophagales archaeon]